jgi:hypothetical protein
MTLKEKILIHQVHPGKLATDIAAAFISLYFFWQHDLIVGFLTHFLRPPIASIAVMHFANLEGYKNSRLGAYLLRYMTPTAQATRLLGEIIMVFAAWFHSPIGIAAGLVIILAAWTYGPCSHPSAAHSDLPQSGDTSRNQPPPSRGCGPTAH